MNRKAVFFDADGTLCDMEKGVPQSTKEAQAGAGPLFPGIWKSFRLPV